MDNDVVNVEKIIFLTIWGKLDVHKEKTEIGPIPYFLKNVLNGLNM